MATTGWINCSDGGITFTGIANVASYTHNSFDSAYLSANGGYTNLRIHISDNRYQYGTIDSVSIKYTVYQSRTGALYDKCTARTGYIRSGSDNSGSFTWAVTHEKEVGKGSSNKVTFTDTFTPAKSNDGQYYLLIGGVNENNGLKQYIYFSDISINITYTPARYTLTTEVSPDGAGTVKGGGTYDHNTHATLTAEANDGYKFVKFRYNAYETADNPIQVLVTYNTTVTAYFEKIPPPEFTSVEMIYGGKQISPENKVIAGQGFIISVTVT